MTTLQSIIERCLAEEGAYLDNPFGEIPICAKRRGHIFAEIYPRPGDIKIKLRCVPGDGESSPGIPMTEILDLIDRSYETLVQKHPGKR